AEALGLAGHVRRVCEAADAALRSAVGTPPDAGRIKNQRGPLHFFRPSVENHQKKPLHHGRLYPVKFVLRLLPSLAAEDYAAAITMAEGWRNLPSRLGPRMWLQALRDKHLFQLEEVLAALSALPLEDFWAHRREIILVMQERLIDAVAAQI